MEQNRGWKYMQRIILFFVILSILLTPIVLASDEIQAVLFPVGLRLNGQPATTGTEAPVLNYENRVYVPLRFVAEQMGADVFYSEEKRTVSVKHSTPHPLKSKVADAEQQSSFVLALRSAKDHYFQEESLRIWATFTYYGEEEVSVAHATPLIAFEVIDAQGRTVHSELFTHGSSVFQPYDEYRIDLPLQLIRAFNTADPDHLNAVEMLHDLPQGKYTVVATARVTPEERSEPLELQAQIEIEVH